MKRRGILLIAVCMIANMLAPVLIAGTDDGIAASPADRVLPAMRFNAACGMPVSAIDRLMNGANPLTPAYTTRGSLQEEGGLPLGFLRSDTVRRSIIAARVMCDVSAIAGVRSGFEAGSGSAMRHWPPGMDGFIYLIVLLYMIVLSRSNLPWAIVPVLCRKGPGL